MPDTASSGGTEHRSHCILGGTKMDSLPAVSAEEFIGNPLTRAQNNEHLTICFLNLLCAMQRVAP
eukprot:267063-Amphidinium_carterae.1